MQEKSLVLVGSPDLEPDQVEMAEDAKLNTCVIYNEQGCIYRAIFEDFLSRKRIKPANAIEVMEHRSDQEVCDKRAWHQTPGC